MRTDDIIATLGGDWNGRTEVNFALITLYSFMMGLPGRRVNDLLNLAGPVAEDQTHLHPHGLRANLSNPNQSFDRLEKGSNSMKPCYDRQPTTMGTSISAP